MKCGKTASKSGTEKLDLCCRPRKGLPQASDSSAGPRCWTKKEFGKPVERLPLPPGKDVPLVHCLKFPSQDQSLNRERLLRRFSGIPIPAKSTIHAVLDRHGLVERRGRVRRRAQGTALSFGKNPNELWCTDFKGEFLLGNDHYCYPLTVTDHASRYLLACEALSSTKENYAFTVFERLFKERGLPANIRSDNGVPFASAHALFNLSKLAVWWLRLGIGIERIKPGHPQQNGRHERMHLTLKKEATKPASGNFLQQ